MGAVDSDTFFFEELQRIKGLDCSTSKCYANAFCTGYLRRAQIVGWAVEYECPDCRSKGAISNNVVIRLVDRLREANPDEQERLVKSFVKSRPRSPHPFRAPWTD